ncbi:hypothetical protein MNBD_GAMMA24-1593 [hydrothermal vent metagenome]|uniref:RES domain-containing protein n=1 Tax=hydrothermal vent metagenome TaxID=652676 RepID=A0A3B1BJ81_9ZZZZ
MAKFPEPPEVKDLRVLSPQIDILLAGTEVYRIFFADGDHPTRWNQFRYFGPTASRFDHHRPGPGNVGIRQNRGIMYLAQGPEAIPTCLAEVFQTTKVIDRHSRNPVLCGFKLMEDVPLLGLRGTFPTVMGASMAIHSGARPRARRWSQCIYDAYTQIHGIHYCSSMYGNEPVIALFERAVYTIPAHPIFHRTLNDRVLDNILIGTADKIRYQLV